MGHRDEARRTGERRSDRLSSRISRSPKSTATRVRSLTTCLAACTAWMGWLKTA
jgi:hypothetical protein